MPLVRSTAVIAALLASLGMGLLAVGYHLHSWIPAAVGLPWLTIGLWLWLTARSYVALDIAAHAPRSAPAIAAPPGDDERQARERAVRYLVQAWAGGNPTTKDWAKENYKVGQDTWEKARQIALSLHGPNGEPLFELVQGQGGKQLQRVRAAAYNEVAAALEEQMQPLF